MRKKIKQKKECKPSNRVIRQRKIKLPESDVKVETKVNDIIDPLDQVRKLSELERMRFVELDTVLQNLNLEIQNIAAAHKVDQLEFNNRCTNRQVKISELKKSIKLKMIEQEASLAELGRKYGFNPKAVSIDDQTGLIHELKDHQ